MSLESATLSDTLLGFGLFCMATAIVGGGLKSFGFELGPLASVRRQAILFIFGAILVVSSAEKKLVVAWRAMFPYQTIVEKFGPFSIAPTQQRSFPLKRMEHGGTVLVTIQNIQFGRPGNEVRVYLCSAEKPGDCKNEQLGVGCSISDILPSGNNVVNIYSYASNAPLTVSFVAEHTE
jgi:hypothetical protein